MNRQEIIESIYTWLIGGGIGLILTTLATLLITRRKKNAWKQDAREEVFDDLLVSVTNLTVVVGNMTEIFVMVFSTSRGIPKEVKEEIENRLEKMRKEAIYKVSKTTQAIIELSKEKTKEAKEKAQKLATVVKEETEAMITELKKETEDLVSKKVGQAFEKKG